MKTRPSASCSGMGGSTTSFGGGSFGTATSGVAPFTSFALCAVAGVGPNATTTTTSAPTHPRCPLTTVRPGAVFISGPPCVAPVRSGLIDSQALFHGVALVPDEYVEGRQLRGPFWGELAHALSRNAVDVVVENGPRVAQVSRVEALARLCGPKGLAGGRFEIVDELALQLHVRSRAHPGNVPADQRVEGD